MRGEVFEPSNLTQMGGSRAASVDLSSQLAYALFALSRGIPHTQPTYFLSTQPTKGEKHLACSSYCSIEPLRMS